MKKPKGKLHLIDVGDHLHSFNGLIMRCGKYIGRGSPAYFADNRFFDIAALIQSGEGFNALERCLDCWMHPPESKEDQRQYVYGILERTEQDEQEGRLAVLEAA